MQLKLSATQIWMANEAVDFRCGLDGLCVIVVNQFKKRPREGIFVFYNRQRDKLKILVWHGNGFAMVYKRLEGGKFTTLSTHQGQIALSEKQLSWLLMGLDWVQLSSWNDLDYDDFS